MDKNHKETIRVRAISVGFAVLALGVFKPFGLDAWKWEVYVHLLMIWMLGFGVCFLTEVILRYVAKMPRSYERGVDYIIRRNLWFQLINTPLVSFMICLYRHFVLSDRVPNNQLSWSNFFETLAIIAFISFAIGLYWRFKYRSRFLAAELQETRLLNEQLQVLQQTESNIKEPLIRQSQLKEQTPDSGQKQVIFPADSVTLTGTTSETLALQVPDLLYVEAVGNYVKVHHLHDGQVHTDMLRATSKQMEDELKAYPMVVRCHRAFLVHLGQVEQIVSRSGTMQLLIKHCHASIPVSRSNMAQVKDAILRVK